MHCVGAMDNDGAGDTDGAGDLVGVKFFKSSSSCFNLASSSASCPWETVDGGADAKSVGLGDLEGEADAVTVGVDEGDMLGKADGLALGTKVGTPLGE